MKKSVIKDANNLIVNDGLEQTADFKCKLLKASS